MPSSMLSAAPAPRRQGLALSASKASRSTILTAAAASTIGLVYSLATSRKDQKAENDLDKNQAQGRDKGCMHRALQGNFPRAQNDGSFAPLIDPTRLPCYCEASVVEPQPAIFSPAKISSGPPGKDDSMKRIPSPRTIQRRQTLNSMDSSATRKSVASLYDMDPVPLGEGAYGEVFQAKHKCSGELFALKKISKEFSDETEFQREMSALLHIKACGGHPNICMLRENFDEKDHFVLILDLIKGGEMFDHLISNGAYSEADAARLVREVASALSFLHGIGVVHADLKPENLMLSSKNKGEAAVKVIDFGCADILPEYWGEGPPLDGGDGTDDEAIQKALLLPARKISPGRVGGTTPAYCPPEAFDEEGVYICPSVDMWSLGVIVYIMLTGVHPFDVNSNLSDEEIEQEVKKMRTPPLEGSPYTAHLSPSAIDLLSRLMAENPEKRLTSYEMLQHPWVRGDTARQDIIAESDKRLSKIRRFRSKIEAKVFANLINWSDDDGRRDPSNTGTSLFEKAFASLDEEKKGFVTMEDVAKFVGGAAEEGKGDIVSDDDTSVEAMPISGFSDLVGDNLRSKFFPRGHVIFNEGDLGDYMYFLNSGTVEVSTKDGFRAKLGQGDSTGEGSLLRPGARRSATVRCLTPVHAIQVDKEYFKKYLSSSETLMALKLREKVNTRNFGRAEFIIAQQEDLDGVECNRDHRIFSVGDNADKCYVVDEGTVEVRAQTGKLVYKLEAGDIFGVQSLIMDRPRKASATCISDKCKLRSMDYRKFSALLQSSQPLKRSLHDMCFRREFRRAVVLRSRKSFPGADELKPTFDEIDVDGSGDLSIEEMREALRHLDKSLSEGQIRELIKSMDLNDSGKISYEEFKSVFGRS